jgi:hypothetical protein
MARRYVNPGRTEGLVKQHILAALQRDAAWEAAEEGARRKLEADGYRLVGGDCSAQDGGWEITDYRSGAVLASGKGLNREEASAAYERASDELDKAQPIYHVDHIEVPDGLMEYPPAPCGLPPSLADAIADWACGVDRHEGREEIVTWAQGQRDWR